jgi:hypothetical protein
MEIPLTFHKNHSVTFLSEDEIANMFKAMNDRVKVARKDSFLLPFLAIDI